MKETGSTSQAGKRTDRQSTRLTSPALLLALAFAAGVSLAGTDHDSPHELLGAIPVLLIAAALSLIAGAVLIRLQRERSAVAVTVSGFVFAGALAGLLFSFRFPPDHVSHLEKWKLATDQPLRVEGTLRTDCAPTPSGCEFDLEAGSVAAISGLPEPRRASGRIRVQLAASAAAAASGAAPVELRSGDRIQATMRLHRPRVYLNPGSFDFRRRAASIEDLYWQSTVTDATDLHRIATGTGGFGESLIESVRARLRHAIDHLYPPWSVEGRNGAVLKAILLGDRTALDSSTVDHFRASGLYHVLVIAGLHVGLIAALVLGLLRLLGLKRRWRNSLLLAVLLAYALVVEQRAPTLRATLMLVIYVLAQSLERDHNALNAVGLAALALLVARPAWLFESGFQLSFAAALLIVGIAAPILRMTLEPYRNALRRLEDVDRDAALPPRQAQFRLDVRMIISLLRRQSALLNRYPVAARRIVVWPLHFGLWAAGMVLFSAVLQVGLLLPMVEQFHRVTLAGVGLNALALPLMGILLAVAIPTVLLATVAPSAALWPAKILSLVFHALFAIAGWPRLPAWLSYRVPSPPVWIAIGFVVALFVAAICLGRNRLGLIASSLVFAVFALALTSAPFGPDLPRGAFEVTALDCGGGEAALLTLPDRSTVLMGAGGTGRARPEFVPAKRWDPGENIVSPYLWSRRIKALDVLVAASSAGNLDGLISIVQNFSVRELWFRDSDPGVAPILEEAARRHVTTRLISRGESLRLGESFFEVLTAGEETRSGVFRGVQPPFAIRVTSVNATTAVAGGGSPRELRWTLGSGGGARCLVLSGGRRTLVWVLGSDSLLPAELPVAEADLSADPQDNRTPDPPQPTDGGRTFTTDHDGAVTIEMRAGAVRVTTFRQEKAAKP